jgi:hypothetical protein
VIDRVGLQSVREVASAAGEADQPEYQVDASVNALAIF